MKHWEAANEANEDAPAFLDVTLTIWRMRSAHQWHAASKLSQRHGYRTSGRWGASWFQEVPAALALAQESVRKQPWAGSYLASRSAFSRSAWATVSASWYFFLLFITSLTDSCSSAWTAISWSVHWWEIKQRERWRHSCTHGESVWRLKSNDTHRSGQKSQSRPPPQLLTALLGRRN